MEGPAPSLPVFRPRWGLQVRLSLSDPQPLVRVQPHPTAGVLGAGSWEQRADTSAATQRPWGHPRAASQTALPLVTIPEATRR